MRCTLLPLDNMKEATAYHPLGDQSLLRGRLLRRSPLCLSSRVGPGVLCVAVVALRVRGAKGFCGRERFWAGEKQRRRKRGTLISFVVRRRLGDEGFLCRGKGEKKRNEKTFMYIPSGFLSLLAWLAVSRGRRFGNRKGRKRQEEQEQSKTRTTKKMKSGKLMCYKLLCHKRFGNRKLYQRLCETMSLKFVAVKRGKTKN